MMKAKAVLKALLCSYTLTGALLLILAFLLFKMDLSERIVSMGIVAIYILSCFLGGLVLGKRVKKQKYVWGLLLGMGYFMLLVGVSCLVEKGFPMDIGHMAATLAICVGGGTLGGMIS